MKEACLAAGLLSVILGSGLVSSGNAQTVPATAYSTQSQQTITGTAMYPAIPLQNPGVARSQVGQLQTVNYDNRFLGIGFGKNISKTVTMEPGFRQISLDGLGWRDRVHLTLVNPSSTPLQFETTQRWGKQVVAVVPPHSQDVLTFTQSRPISHEIRYVVMQQPDNAIATGQDYVTQQTAAVAAVDQAATREALNQQTAMMRQAMDQQTAQLQTSQQDAIRSAMNQRQTERRSAVRGFW